MAISYKSVGTIVGAASGSLSLTPGTIADDDIELACIVADGTATFSRAGWSDESGTMRVVSGQPLTGHVLWHRAASESGAQSFSDTGGTNLCGLIIAFSGCKTGATPIHKVAVASGNGTAVSVDLTSGNAPTVNGCQIVLIIMVDGEVNSLSGHSGGSLTWTEHSEQNDPATAFKNISVASAPQATAAGITCTATVSAATEWTAIAIALEPPGAGPSGSLISRDKRTDGGMGPQMSGGMSAHPAIRPSIFLPPRRLVVPRPALVHLSPGRSLEVRP
jgi:hypothetical protein